MTKAMCCIYECPTCEVLMCEALDTINIHHCSKCKQCVSIEDIEVVARSVGGEHTKARFRIWIKDDNTRKVKLLAEQDAFGPVGVATSGTESRILLERLLKECIK